VRGDVIIYNLDLSISSDFWNSWLEHQSNRVHGGMFDSAVSSKLPSRRASPMQKGIFYYTRGADDGDGASYNML
jgi:hypothetical protein